MKIEVDEAKIQSDATEAIERATVEALGGWECKQALTKAVADGIADSTIIAAVTAAIKGLDGGALTRSIAAEMQRCMASAVSAVVQDALVEMVCKLRGVSEYGSDRDKVRARIKAELFSRLAEEGSEA